MGVRLICPSVRLISQSVMMNCLPKVSLLFVLSISVCQMADHDQCCTRKSNGGEMYSLVSEDAAGARDAGCHDDCVYTKESNTGSRFCFKWGSGTTVCKDDEPSGEPSGESSCPADWTAHQSKCYKLFEETLSWEDAESYCQAEGAHLASVLNQEENNFIAGLASEKMWLGGTDKVNEGTFVWTDGSSFSFTSWSPDNPDNAGNQDGVTSGADNQNCLTTNYLEPGLWDDLWCTNQDNPTKFVCKK